MGCRLRHSRASIGRPKAHAKKAREALAEEDVEKATKLWREIFGDRFPKVKSNKSAGLLGVAAAPRTALFPDHPVQPNKPKGFA